MSAAKKTKQRARSLQESTASPLRNVAICGVLVALIWTVFGQTLGHDFVNYDDKTYVYENPLVRGGLSWQGIGKAFVDTRTRNWHPLTIISHMIDCQLFDLTAGGHHFTNVLLHSLAAVLLFLWLRSLTNATWPSAFVAALFAIHPLRVESVAWIAERKDVLSAVFFFLTLIAYLRYVRAPSLGRYVAMSILFACGLMSKVMLVTLPAVLLLLDYWPLNRWQSPKRKAQSGGQWSVVSGLVLEKIPLAALSLAAAIITFVLQIHSRTSVDQLPLSWRAENALVSYITYIWQMFWPSGLAVFYPHPENHIPVWQIAACAFLLLSITAFVFVFRRTRPYLLVGWLWYLVMLLPVIGIIEVGLQGHADRYTYLPQIGLYLMITWAIVDLLSSTLGVGRLALGVCCLAIVITLSACAYKQTTYWRNSETLWTRVLAVTKGNDVALTNLGGFYMAQRRIDEALSCYEQALAVRSSSAQSHYSLSLAVIHNSLGNALALNHRLREAIEHMRESVRLRPDYPDSHYNLATLLLQRGDVDGAIAEWRTMLSLRPEDAGAHASFADALVEKGLWREAAGHYEKALQFDPDSILALNNLAWIMSAGPDDSIRNNENGLKLALKANELSNNANPTLMRTLAAAYAQAGQFEKAIDTGQHATEIADRQGERKLARQIMDDVDLYRRHEPLRERALGNAQ